MMSLFKTSADGFEPLTVHSLETFNDEVSNADEGTEPDFDRFKLLVEKPQFGKENLCVFEALYKAPEEVEEVVFKPLIEKKETRKTPQQPNGNQSESNTGELSIESNKDEMIPEQTPEEIGYQEGFEKGMAQGEQDGYDAGFEKGLADGEAKGLEQGLEKGFEQGRQEGFDQGLEKGKSQGEQESQAASEVVIKSLEETLKKADETLEKLVDIYEERIIDLVQKIARKVVLAHVEMDDEAVKPLVIEALKHLVEPEDVVLTVSTEDYEYIDMVKDTFFETIQSLNHVSVRSDPAIGRGGCRIETHTGTVSTDPESRLNDIFDAMKDTGNK
jgi:flagellar assembly protein FliH